MYEINVRRVGIACAVLVATALRAQTPQFQTPVHFTADGVTQPETQVGSFLQAAPETPDCSHLSFGPYLTQTPANGLGDYVYVFNIIHVVPDNDRCSATDRQRLEIKSELYSNPTPYQNYHPMSLETGSVLAIVISSV